MEELSHYNAEGTTLRKAQLRMLDILIEIDKVCRKHNIDYWLDYGTLLGAIRHSGFVPWDDDIDITIKREDYKQLREALMRELPEQFVFTDIKTDKNFYCNYARVRDKYSNVNYPPFKHQKEQGLFVDIFVVEKANPKIKRFVDLTYGPVFRQVHNFGKYLYKSNSKRILYKGISLALYPFAYLLVLFSRAFAKCSKADIYTFSYSTMFLHNGKEKDIFPLTEIKFEGHYFKAPKNSDAYLRPFYGDYMQLPEESKRTPMYKNIVLFD